MAHSYTVEKFLKVPTEWHPPRRDAEGNWIDPRDDLLPGCAIQCNTWLNEYNVCPANLNPPDSFLRLALIVSHREMMIKEIVKRNMKNSRCVKTIV